MRSTCASSEVHINNENKRTYRFLVRHESLHEEVELVPLEDLLEVHLREHHAVRGVLGRVVQVAQPLVLHKKR